MPRNRTRRQVLKELGLSAAAAPLLMSLPSLSFAQQGTRKQRMIVVFSPNGVVPKTFWPDEEGAHGTLKESLSPFEPFKDRLLTMHGVCNRIRGDGDGHMRGIGCMLTGSELFPGNIQGGSDTPAGWSSGISIDQEIKNYLQANPETRTRFGSLEFGVMVPNRADTWTRMSYTGPNKPIAPIDDPYQMFNKLYGRIEDRESLRSVLDDLQLDMQKLRGHISAEDRRLLEEHTDFMRDMERELAQSSQEEVGHAVPELEPGVDANNDNMPKLIKMQIDLMVNSLKADYTRIASLQITNSVGQARMRWLGIDEGHHQISHEPNSNDEAMNKLTQINKWYAEQIAYLVKKLSDTPEPGGEGSMLDNTLIVWTNELGEGNSHTPNNIPWTLIGNAPGIDTGRAIKFDRLPHNRLLMSLAHSFGHNVESFGNPDYCKDGPLVLTG